MKALQMYMTSFTKNIIQNNRYHNMSRAKKNKSQEIKRTDGRKNNKRLAPQLYCNLYYLLLQDISYNHFQ